MRKKSAIYLSCAEDEFSTIQSGADVNLKHDIPELTGSNPSFTGSDGCFRGCIVHSPWQCIYSATSESRDICLAL